MELALNLGWTAMAIAMCWLWVRHARREGQGRWTQFASLGLILVIMFAVVTMYDDMAMAQNPAETRCFQREDDLGAHERAPLHPVAASIPTAAPELPFNTFCCSGRPSCSNCAGSRSRLDSESSPSRGLIHGSHSIQLQAGLLPTVAVRGIAQRPLQKVTCSTIRPCERWPLRSEVIRVSRRSKGTRGRESS